MYLNAPINVKPQGEGGGGATPGKLIQRAFPILEDRENLEMSHRNLRNTQKSPEATRPFSIMLVKPEFNATRNSRIKPKIC